MQDFRERNCSHFLTRMHSSGMHTAHSSGRPGGGSPPGIPLEQATPRPSTPLLPEQTPPRTYASENIALPKTSFAGGKNDS